jgi:hypothetical protein
MEIQFSARDTGACPLCKKHNNCTIQNSITASFKNVDPDSDTHPMEMVVYVCPYFAESG